MRAPDDHHLHQAAHLIQRMRMTRPTCDSCETMSFWKAADAFRYDSGEIMRASGYEMRDDRPAWVKRCDTCANGKMFPWADKLEAERVADFLEHDVRCQSAFELSLLEETLQEPKGYRFPVCCAIENGQRTRCGDGTHVGPYNFLADGMWCHCGEKLAGNEAKAPEIKVTLTPPIPFQRVGSTDICCKCLILTGSGECKCPPEERVFFRVDGPIGKAIKDYDDACRLIAKQLVTCETCGKQFDCKCDDNPRGGFEFL